MSGRREVAWVLVTAYSALVLVLTIGPIRQRYEGSEADRGVLDLRSWFERSTWLEGTMGEFVANVALFVPWGVLAVLALGAGRWVLAGFGAAALTLTIEIAQIPLARISDPRDLVANMLGALVGIAIGAAVDAALTAGDHRRARASTATAGRGATASRAPLERFPG